MLKKMRAAIQMAILASAAALIAANVAYLKTIKDEVKELALRQSAVAYLSADSPFYYFGGYNTIKESGSPSSSNDPYWWLNSGGLFYLSDGVGKTIEGSLSTFSYWRLAYSVSNPTDTDNGYHPQNILRLISRKSWDNSTEEAYFKITNTNLSQSPNRNESNGLLLIERYKDSDNLYYAGIRVDGAAVIKKKIKGDYYTIAYAPVFSGQYDRMKNPNLLPAGKRIGVKVSTINKPDGSVALSLYLDKDASGNWQDVIDAEDNGKDYGGQIFDSGSGGIRTDFMDVEVDSYKIYSE